MPCGQLILLPVGKRPLCLLPWPRVGGSDPVLCLSLQNSPLDLIDMGKGVKVQTEKPHLVSLGSGRLSTAITLLPLEEGECLLTEGWAGHSFPEARPSVWLLEQSGAPSPIYPQGWVLLLGLALCPWPGLWKSLDPQRALPCSQRLWWPAPGEQGLRTPSPCPGSGTRSCPAQPSKCSRFSRPLLHWQEGLVVTGPQLGDQIKHGEGAKSPLDMLSVATGHAPG